MLAACSATAARPVDISADLSPLLGRHGVPGLVAAAARSNVVVATGAAGLRKIDVPSVPVTLADKFHVGSCTKAMTATLAAILVQEGRIRWDTTVGDAFPDLRAVHAQWKNVTLRQLLQNRGGAPSHEWLNSEKQSDQLWGKLWTNHVAPADQRQFLVSEVTRRPPEKPPGTEYLYSNVGFSIAGRMLERAAGMPWEELMRARLFQPLGLKSAGFGVPATPRYLNEPWGHSWDGRAVPVEPGTAADNPPSIGPGGTVHMKVTDFVQFASAHARGEVAGAPWLTAPLFQTLHTPVAVNENMGYAMGWQVVKRPWGGQGMVLTHSGSNNQWFAVMWIAPAREFAAVAATNCGGDPGARATDAAVSLLVERFAD